MRSEVRWGAEMKGTKRMAEVDDDFRMASREGNNKLWGLIFWFSVVKRSFDWANFFSDWSLNK